jgi:hypothetical protein
LLDSVHASGRYLASCGLHPVWGLLILIPLICVEAAMVSRVTGDKMDAQIVGPIVLANFLAAIPWLPFVNASIMLFVSELLPRALLTMLGESRLLILLVVLFCLFILSVALALLSAVLWNRSIERKVVYECLGPLGFTYLVLVVLIVVFPSAFVWREYEYWLI